MKMYRIYIIIYINEREHRKYAIILKLFRKNKYTNIINKKTNRKQIKFLLIIKDYFYYIYIYI